MKKILLLISNYGKIDVVISKVHLPRLYVISVIRPIFNEIEIRLSNNKILSKNIHQKEKRRKLRRTNAYLQVQMGLMVSRK